MKRREFLRVLGGAGLAIPSCLAGSGCGVKVLPSDHKTGLSLGYVVGDVTDRSALVWLRAEPGSRVSLEFDSTRDFSLAQSTPALAVEPSADHCAIFSLNDLRSGTRYYYRAQVAGKAPGPTASFLTAPVTDENAKVVFCFSGDSRESYQPFTIMSAVQAQQPDFLLLLGDTIYADKGGSARTLEEFWQKYRSNRSDLFSQSCFATTSVYAVWDDHEVANNYFPSHPLAPIGRQAFLNYWPTRCPATDPERIYRSIRWGQAVEVFVLDARQYRDARKETMLGDRQREWLLESLANSTATFKFIATTVPMAGGGRDRWDGYPIERSTILRYINEKRISGVSFLSADLHYAAVTRIPKSGGLIEITPGPLAAPLNRITDPPPRRYQFFLAENFNFVKITVDPKVSANQALIEFIDQDNRVFHTKKLRA